MESILELKEKSWSIDNTPSFMARSMFYYIQSAGHFYCNPNYVTNRSHYNTILLILTKKGEGYLDYRNSSYTINKNEGFIIDCMEEQHYGTTNNGSWEFVYLHFQGSESKSYVDKILANSGPVFNITDNSNLPDNIDKILHLLQQKEPRLDIIASSIIVQILTELLIQSSTDDSEDNNKNHIPESIHQVLNIIEETYFKDISLDQLAARTGISKYHMSRLFKKHTGYSPYEYLINYRINQGKNLLKTTALTVKEIAHKIGFNSSSHFIKLFNKQTGSTPLQFRKYWR